jgi:hypothetical protein
MTAPNFTRDDLDESCYSCGAAMQATHASWCAMQRLAAHAPPARPPAVQTLDGPVAVARKDDDPFHVHIALFGSCPSCHGEPTFLNVNRHHWALCEPCGVRWSVGWNLLSNWMLEDEAKWFENVAHLDQLAVVEPGTDQVVVDGPRFKCDQCHVQPSDIDDLPFE